MPVKSVINQYRGINAHLHSLLQARGGWGDFHTRHIVHLADALTAALKPLGYVAKIEESVQIRRIEEPPLSARADVLILGGRESTPQLSAEAARHPIPLLELVAEQLSEKPYRAIAIYAINRRERPVVWIELLSPSNKGRGDDADAYRAKRMNLLVGGLVFVELDYLHETAPTFPLIRPYAETNGQRYRLSEAHPYRIIVADPRPQLEQGWAQVEGFDVDQPLPTVELPLEGDDRLAFDFDAPYQKTFREGDMGADIDYAQLPLNFERYSSDDQARIARRMLAVCEAARRGGDNLEAGDFPVDEGIGLAEALRLIGEVG